MPSLLETSRLTFDGIPELLISVMTIVLGLQGMSSEKIKAAAADPSSEKPAATACEIG